VSGLINELEGTHRVKTFAKGEQFSHLNKFHLILLNKQEVKVI